MSDVGASMRMILVSEVGVVFLVCRFCVVLCLRVFTTGLLCVSIHLILACAMLSVYVCWKCCGSEDVHAIPLVYLYR